MTSTYQNQIKEAYTAFNARDINRVLLAFHPDIMWANGWEGGYVNGHDEVSAYWTRQWKVVDPIVEPIHLRETEDGKLEVEVHQIVKDLAGSVMFDGIVKHIYTIEDGLIKRMDIEK